MNIKFAALARFSKTGRVYVKVQGHFEDNKWVLESVKSLTIFGFLPILPEVLAAEEGLLAELEVRALEEYNLEMAYASLWRQEQFFLENTKLAA